MEFMGDRIQNAREKKGLNSKEAAKLIGVAPSTWSLYEKNKRSPSINTLKLIAEKLDVSSDILIGIKRNNN
jgi:transcriptional regulator with XRE-family HTH domain